MNTGFISRRREMLIMVGAFMVAALFFISMSVWATTIGTNMDATGTIGAATSTPWGTLAAEQVATQGNLDPTFVVGDTGTSTPFIFVSAKGVVSHGSSTPSALFLNPGDTVIGRNGASSDLYVSGGLGVGNATTTDNNLEVLTRIYAGSVVSSGSYFYSAGSATSTFVSSGLSVAGGGLASSKGLTLTGGIMQSSGRLSLTGSATSTWGSSQWADLTVDAAADQTSLHGIFVVGDNGTSSPFMFVSQKGLIRIGTTSRPAATDELIVDSLTSTATSTIHLGNGGSTTRGSCLQMYNSAGTSYRIFISKASTTRLSMEVGACE